MRSGLAALIIFTTLVGLLNPDPVRAQGTPRRLIAYYYAWYDMDTWRSGTTADLPAQLYESADPRAVQRHILQAQSAGIDAFNVVWLGPRNPTDRNLALVLANAERLGFAASIGFETDSPFLHSRAEFADALRYAIASYSEHPAYLRYDGKPVIFFWRLGAIPTEGRASAIEAWREVRQQVDPEGRTLWIGEGDQFQYLQVFDGIHPYSIAWASNVTQILATYASRTREQQAVLRQRKLWVATVMPGYDDRKTGRSDAFARDRAGLGFYRETWAAAVASNPEMIILTSWNEWVEGSQIEPSQTYGALYLGETRSLSTRWKGPPHELPPEVAASIAEEAAFEACDTPGAVRGAPESRLSDGTRGEGALLWVRGNSVSIREEPSERAPSAGAWTDGTPLTTYYYLPGTRADGSTVTWRLVLDADGQCGWVALGLDSLTLTEFAVEEPPLVLVPSWLAELLERTVGIPPALIDDAARIIRSATTRAVESPLVGLALLVVGGALLSHLLRK